MHPIPSFQVLLLSDQNTDRSILAEFILRSKARGRFSVQSAGLLPSGHVDPLAVRTLSERYEITATGARSKSWEEFHLVEFDFIITLSEAARVNCICWRGQPVRAHWGSPRPRDLARSADGLSQAFVDVASQIAARASLFCTYPDEKLVAGAWEAGKRFPFRSDYRGPDEEHLEYAAHPAGVCHV